MSVVNPLPPSLAQLDAVVALDHVSWATFAALASECRGGRLAYDREATAAILAVGGR